MRSKKKWKSQDAFNVVPIPGEIDSELLESTIDFASLIRWCFLNSYFQAGQVLANAYQTIDQKAPAFNLIIMMLRSVVIPLADEEFETNVDELYNEFKGHYGDKYWMVPSYGIALLEEIVKLLKRHDILTVRHGVLDIVANIEPLLKGETDGGSEGS